MTGSKVLRALVPIRAHWFADGPVQFRSIWARPTFKWNTKAEVLAAVGHGHRLIDPTVIGNGKGNQADLIIDLRKDFRRPVKCRSVGRLFLSPKLVDQCRLSGLK